MYPLQQSSELEHQVYTPCQPDKILLHDLPVTLESSNLYPVNDSTRKKQPRSSTEIQEKKKDREGNTNEYKLKRIMHRDLERQRRQEMTNLCASLRSLLPLEYIKGKRAISDHMQEAVNYIKFLQKNIDELRERRNRLLKTSNLSSLSSGNASADSCLTNGLSVMVNSCLDGVEVLICSGHKEGNSSLSRVLRKLLEEGLNVVSCVSTKASEGTVHKILSEVPDDRTSINIMALQQKLMNVINLGSNPEDF